MGKKVIGVASNYKCHVQEMNSKMPTEPILFLKANSSFIIQPHPIRLPKGHRTEYELELAVIISHPGKNIPQSRAYDFIGGYTMALDLTARDLQDKAKEQGLPWTVAKSFDTFLPIGDYIPKQTVFKPQKCELKLVLNGEIRQQVNTSEMIFKIDELVSYISTKMRLERGDMILTGTPKGVGELKPGDVMNAYLQHDFLTMRFRTVQASTGFEKNRWMMFRDGGPSSVD